MSFIMLGILVFHKILSTADGDRFTVGYDEFNRIITAVQSHATSLDPAAMAKTTQEKPSRLFILSFDDGTSDHSLLLNMLGNTKGIFFVNTNNIGRGGYMGKEQIKALFHAGHLIGSHSHNHISLAKQPKEKMRQEIDRSVKILEDLLGEKVDWFAPPEGNYNDAVIKEAHAVGIKYFRTTDFGWNKLISNDTSIKVLNTFNINKHFQSLQVEECLTRKPTYMMYCTAYKTKNLIKKLFPAIYKKVRKASG